MPLRFSTPTLLGFQFKNKMVFILKFVLMVKGDWEVLLYTTRFPGAKHLCSPHAQSNSPKHEQQDSERATDDKWTSDRAAGKKCSAFSPAAAIISAAQGTYTQGKPGILKGGIFF